jgi:VIT1/CCC1 family predicted Fe2+/Mn2+ transporter
MSFDCSTRTTLEASHTPEKIRDRLRAPITHSYLPDFVYGAIDGTVTTFAIVSGVAGAALPSTMIIVLGMANLVADGFSMAASNYLGTRTDEELRKKARRIEEQHIASYPEGEREEVRQIFEEKGFSGADLQRAVEVITADRQRWVDTMLVEELRLPPDGRSATRAALTTFLAFFVVGLIPLLTYIYNVLAPQEIANPFLASAVLTALSFFGVGAAKSRFVDESWHRAGLETLLIGGSAAMLAYAVGFLLGFTVH